MKRVGILMGMGVLLIGSAVWAEDDLDMPQRSHVQPVAAAPAPVVVTSSSACCPTAGCADHGHSADIGDWLLYHPPHTYCACQCVVSKCYPPLHLWFVDMCQGCGGGHAHGHDAAGSCANGACHAAACGKAGCQAAPCASGKCHTAPCVTNDCTMAPCNKEDGSRRPTLLEWLEDFWE